MFVQTRLKENYLIYYNFSRFNTIWEYYSLFEAASLKIQADRSKKDTKNTLKQSPCKAVLIMLTSGLMKQFLLTIRKLFRNSKYM